MKNEAIGYIRNLTEGTSEGAPSLQLQTEEIRDYCERNNLRLVQVMCDSAPLSQGRHTDCLSQIVGAFGAKEAQHLVVYDFAQIFEDQHVTKQLSEICKRNGATVHAVLR